MRRIFLAKRNALLTSSGVSLGAFALAVAAVFFCLRLLVPNLFWGIFSPVFRNADFIATESHRFFSNFNATGNLVLQNEKLLEENTALASENQTLLQKETMLDALLGTSATEKNTATGILAGIVAHPPESPYDTLVLSEGTHAGIAVGMEVFAKGGVPIGTVSSVTDTFSQVTLFSSPGMTITGWVGRANLPLTITGSGAGTMSASLARSAAVAVGDSVFAPGPGMRMIGSVVRIDSDPSSPSVVLRIMPVFNVFSASWVIVRAMGKGVFSFSQATSTLP
ncbi:MAG TPA: rod shape-determining protein MreC [Candidatus Paceibacterota bacterium]|nr:rod shape-determining protein MreC [Candidatus Paceibacterota bacterium]